MKKCILALTVNTSNWGAERSMCSLFNYLQEQGEKVIVVIPHEGQIIDLFNQYKIEYIVQKFDNWVYIDKKISLLRKIRKAIRDEKMVKNVLANIQEKGYYPKIVYSATLTFGTGLRIANILRIPHIQHIRENIDAFGFKFTYGYKNSMHYINSTSSRIICTCDAIKNRYLQSVESSKLITIHNGVIPVDKIPIKNYEGKLNIMQIGRFMNDKRIIDSLNAIKIMIDSGYSNIKLDLYGDGPEHEIYSDFIKKNHLEQYIEIKGFVSNINFSIYHIGLMTSSFEAFARSTLDYMNNGLAVIASNSGGNLEQVVNGQTGLFFEVHDVKSLYCSIKTLYTNRKLLENMCKAGREHFLKNFTQERYVKGVGTEILKFIPKR